MPPGSEAFLAALLNTLLSQYGALVSLLLVVIWYLARELAKERKAHDETTSKLIDLSQESMKANLVVANGLDQFRALVERLATTIDQLRSLVERAANTPEHVRNLLERATGVLDQLRSTIDRRGPPA